MLHTCYVSVITKPSGCILCVNRWNEESFLRNAGASDNTDGMAIVFSTADDSGDYLQELLRGYWCAIIAMVTHAPLLQNGGRSSLQPPAGIA